jgi:HEAT repeat protein
MAETLYKIDPERARKEARPVLRKMLASDNPWRVQAAAALRRAEPDNDEALQALIDCMRAGQAGSREQACNYLGMLGKSAGKAAPALRKALSDSQRSFRVAAAVALWQITGETDSTAPVLLEALKPSPGNFSRGYAANYLGLMGAAVHKAALPELRKLRDDDDPFVRDTVRRAVEQLESSAKKTKTP